MGKISTNADRDDASVVATFSLVDTVGRCGAVTADRVPFHAGGPFNLTVTGSTSPAFSGSYRLVRSFDGGSTWVPCTSGGAPVAYAGDISEAIPNCFEGSVLYDVELMTIAAGSISGRLSR